MALASRVSPRARHCAGITAGNPRCTETEPTGRGCRRARFGSAPARLVRGGTKDAQMATPAHLDALPHRLGGRAAGRGFPDRVGQRLQVVGRGRQRNLLVHRKPDHVPAERGGQPARMPFAQVIAVRLGVSGERPDHCGGIAVDVRQRVDRVLLASRPGTPTRHQPASLTEPGGAAPAEGWTAHILTRADRTDMRQLTPPPPPLGVIVSCARSGKAPVAAVHSKSSLLGCNTTAVQAGYPRELCKPPTRAARSGPPASGGGTGTGVGCGGCWYRRTYRC